MIPEGLEAAEIDAAVRERTGRGEALYELDETTLEELDVDLIVTQAVCQVCAVSFDDVRAVAERLPTQPQVISLDPSTLGEVLADVPRLAAAAGPTRRASSSPARPPSGSRRSSAPLHDAPRPRVAALEWLDPLYVGGHWVPQMIEIAGGEDVLGMPGDRSRTAEWAELEAVAPEVIVSMPCGYYAEQAAAETMLHASGSHHWARACSRWTPPRTSRAPARGSWRASSCSGTCCTRSSCRRRRHAVRSSSTWRPSRTAAIETATAATPIAAHRSSAARIGIRRASRPTPPGRRSRPRPPIRPPMCAPIEMFETVNVISRLRPSQIPSPLSRRLKPRAAEEDECAAHEPEDSARGARGGAPDSSSTPSEPHRSDTK